MVEIQEYQELFMWSKKKGFSLLEVLVAVSLLGLILTFIFRSFVDFSQNSQKTENILYLSRELNALKKLMETDFGSIIFLQSYTNDYESQSIRYFSGIQGDNKLIGSSNTDQIFFHVNRNSINFNQVEVEKDPKLHEIGYFVTLVEEDKYNLYRTEQYYIDSKPNNYIGIIADENITEFSNVKNSLVTSNIVDFNIRYLNHQFIWLDSWNSISNQNQHDIERNKGRIPQAVEVEITLKRDNIILKNAFILNLRPVLGKDIYWSNF